MFSLCSIPVWKPRDQIAAKHHPAGKVHPSRVGTSWYFRWNALRKNEFRLSRRYKLNTKFSKKLEFSLKNPQKFDNSIFLPAKFFEKILVSHLYFTYLQMFVLHLTPHPQKGVYIYSDVAETKYLPLKFKSNSYIYHSCRKTGKS